MKLIQKRSGKPILSHFKIVSEKDTLFYHEYPQLFMGLNKYGKTLIFSLYDDDKIDKNNIYYLTIVLNQNQADNFKNNIYGFIDLLKQVPFVYIVQSNLESEIIKVFEFDFEEIPKEDLPSSNFKYNSVKKFVPDQELIEIENTDHILLEDNQSLWSYFFEKAIQNISFSVGSFAILFSIIWTFKESLDPLMIQNVNETYILIAILLLILIAYLTRKFIERRREYEMKKKLLFHDLWIQEIINDLKLSPKFDNHLLSKSEFISLLRSEKMNSTFSNSENYYPRELIQYITRNEDTLSYFLTKAVKSGLIKLFFDNRREGNIKIKVLR